MKTKLILFLLLLTINASVASAKDIPYLKKQGHATQLIVEGKPFLIRGGELGNTTASNINNLNKYWDKFETLNVNTLLAPVYWDLFEPEEGIFDFTLVDQLIAEARKHDTKLVLLWFATWKNSMSSHCPAWVKEDTDRFPRSKGRNEEVFEILSPFYEESWKADAKAFRKLMAHLKETDNEQQTVIMVQPENEIGMVDYARDYDSKANELYSSNVPNTLIQYLQSHYESLAPELKTEWGKSGYKKSGSWSDVFGNSPQSEEIFMAWHYALYTEHVTRAGKSEYDLPMFVNAALIRPGYQPGQYVSAGPLPHLIDVWRAAAPSIDFISPDIYFPEFNHWTRLYKRSGNPLFIPEALRNNDSAVNALFAFSEHGAIGFCPFGIESITGHAAILLQQSYNVIKQLEPLLTIHQGKKTLRGFLRESAAQKKNQLIRIDNYEMSVKFEYATPPSLADGVINESGDKSRGPLLPAGGLVIQLGDNEFLFAGIGITITFDSLTPGQSIGILSAESGHFVDGEWQNLLWNNGDQTHQGRHVRLTPGSFSMQKVKLYQY